MILLEGSQDKLFGSQEEQQGSQAQQDSQEQLKDSLELHQERDSQGIHRQQMLEQGHNLGMLKGLLGIRILQELELMGKERNLLVLEREHMDKVHNLQELGQELEQVLELIQEQRQNVLQGKFCLILFLCT